MTTQQGLERCAQKGDTVILEFTGPGNHREEEYPHLMDWDGEHPAAGTYNGCLFGKRAGDSVTLPEPEQNESYATILRIERPTD